MPVSVRVPAPPLLNPSRPPPAPFSSAPENVWVVALPVLANSHRVVALPLAIVPLPARPVAVKSWAPMASVPSATVSVPAIALAAVGLIVSVPPPVLVSPAAELLIRPTVSVPAVTSTARAPLVPPSVTVPVPMSRSWLPSAVPANAKSPDHVWAGFEASVSREPVVLSSDPPAIVMPPVPRAAALPRLRRPALSVVPPE